MVSSCTCAAAIVSIVVASTAAAQSKPDFSGDWTLNPQKSTLSPIVAPAVQSGTLQIEHREPNFKAHLNTVLSGRPIDATFELVADGREVVATNGDRRNVSSLVWDGDALVLTFRDERPNATVTISFRYELQDGGRRLRAIEQIRGGGRDQDNVWVYDR